MLPTAQTAKNGQIQRAGRAARGQKGVGVKRRKTRPSAAPCFCPHAKKRTPHRIFSRFPLRTAHARTKPAALSFVSPHTKLPHLLLFFPPHKPAALSFVSHSTQKRRVRFDQCAAQLLSILQNRTKKRAGAADFTNDLRKRVRRILSPYLHQTAAFPPHTKPAALSFVSRSTQNRPTFPTDKRRRKEERRRGGKKAWG